VTRLTLATANTPGAVAILQLHGDGVIQVLTKLTGRNDWPDRRAVLCDFAGIDEGLAVPMNRQAAQLMPHGGPRVVQRLIEHLTKNLGCTYDPAPDNCVMYPEAASPIEADMLDAIARAASPAAIDLLAQQPNQWAGLLRTGVLQAGLLQQAGELNNATRQTILARSRILDRLIVPPTVVVVGPANVGKSTLTNALMGRALSIVADLPGTTRDWVGGLVELTSRGLTAEAIAVHWLDTPGLRDSDDAIEQRAIALAREQVERADVLIAMRDPQHDWPDASALPRTPDLWVVNKIDDAVGDALADAGRSAESPLSISAANAIGLNALQHRVIQSLGLDRLSTDEPWAFSATLKSWCGSDDKSVLRAYLASSTTK